MWHPRLGTKHIRMLVLDEADEMLQEGFKDQIYNIFVLMPENIQVPKKFFIKDIFIMFRSNIRLFFCPRR